MGKFSYTVQDAAGGTTNGVLDAGSEQEAVSVLQGKGFFILSIKHEAAAKGLAARIPGRGGVGGRDLVFFGEQLATLLNGGVPLVRALSLIGEHAENRNLGHVVEKLAREVAAGQQFFKAMERHPEVFSPLWVNLVQAGELGGRLPQSLKQISGYLQSEEELKGKVLTALMYPAVLFMISMGVLVFFIVKIIPTFKEIFESFNLKLPLFTQTVIGFSTLVVDNRWLIVGGVVGGGAALRGYLATDAGQFTKAKVLFALPFFGRFIKNIQTERLLTTLTTLIESGVSILNALSVLEGVFSANVVFQKGLKTVRMEVSQGKSIAEAFRKTGIFPPLMTEMMWMGEESGKLPEIMKTLSDFYKEQIDQFIRRFTSIIDPVMVVFIGGIVSVIVLSIFMPIFQLSKIGSQ